MKKEITIPKYWYVEKEEKNPIWEECLEWINKKKNCNSDRKWIYSFYWYAGCYDYGNNWFNFTDFG